MTDEEQQENQEMQNSLGRKMSSVSISPHFKNIIVKHNLSPTEVFRRGIAVTLYDIGEEQYLTETNQKRSEFAKKFLDDVDRFNLISNLHEIEKKVSELKRLIKNIDEYTTPRVEQDEPKV